MSNKPEITPELKAMVLREINDRLDLMIEAVHLAFKTGQPREDLFEIFCKATLDQIRDKRDKQAIAALHTMAIMRLAEQEMLTKN